MRHHSLSLLILMFLLSTSTSVFGDGGRNDRRGPNHHQLLDRLTPQAIRIAPIETAALPTYGRRETGFRYCQGDANWQKF